MLQMMIEQIGLANLQPLWVIETAKGYILLRRRCLKLYPLMYYGLQIMRIFLVQVLGPFQLDDQQVDIQLLNNLI